MKNPGREGEYDQNSVCKILKEPIKKGISCGNLMARNEIVNCNINNNHVTRVFMNQQKTL